ncbi:MAG: hypothetical protein AB1351_05035 [Thermoproteota archaeon]
MQCTADLLPIFCFHEHTYERDMESVSRSEKGASLSSILSVIGGSLMVAGGVLALSMFSIWIPAGMPGWGGGMMGGGFDMMSGGFMWAAVGTMSAISIGAGAVSVVGGYSIYKKPESANMWGVAILISGIVGLFGMGGFIIGPILGIIGGILALTKRQG